MNEQVVEERIKTVCLVVIAIVAAGMAAYFLKPVLIPFILAIFFVYLLAPLIDVQVEQWKVPPMVAVGTTLVLGCALLSILGGMVYATFTELSANAGLYQEKAVSLADETMVSLEKSFGAGWMEESFGVKFEDIDVKGSVGKMLEQSMGTAISSTVSAVLGVVSNGILVVIFMFFLLMGRTSARMPGVWGEIEQSIKSYIGLKVLVSLITGGLHGAVLWFLGVEFALLFAILAFFLNFIPNLGPVIATVMVVPVLPLTEDATWVTWTLALAIPGTIQFVSGNVIEPKIIGDSLDVHPVVVLLTLIFFGMIWGIIGMFLATPITAVIKILLEKVEFTRPLADLLAGRVVGIVGTPEDLVDEVKESAKEEDSAEGEEKDGEEKKA